MKTSLENVTAATLKSPANFNHGPHLRVELEPDINQTISVKLPNGKFVTLAFCPASTPGEFECMDIHTNTGPRVARNDGGMHAAHVQHLLGFTYGHDTFSTRRCAEPTTLATLLRQMKKQHRKKSLFIITGRIGGKSTSKAKRLAAIANGKKGGRPKGSKNK